jgi:hypothetical protein
MSSRPVTARVLYTHPPLKGKGAAPNFMRVELGKGAPPANKVVVAVANKLARIVWAVLYREQAYWFADASAEA